MMAPRVLLIEFNEITPTLVSRFMREGALPNFKRLYERSAIYRTDAEDAPLEPWIQWPTIHTGQPHDVHGAKYLGEGRRVAFPGIATILSQAGHRVGVLGTINSNYRALNGYFIPDPWDDADHVAPEDARPFFRFVSKHVQENSRHATAAPREALEFARFMVRSGLSWRTVWAAGLQIVREVLQPVQKWRRALILDLLQYDVFRHLNARFEVEFASFFSNSTAHLQHYFWRDMEPDRFDVAPVSADASLKHAIRDAYVAMDRLLERIVADHPGALIYLCSGLSQKAWNETTKCTYRPHDFARFLDFAGIRDLEAVPVMAERFRIECASNDEAERACERLNLLEIDGKPFVGTEVRGTVLFAGCDVYDADEAVYQTIVHNGDGARTTFRDLFYRVTSMNSGQHDPAGLLWVETGNHEVIETVVPLTAIAPMILARFTT
jgi:hypothetical protein